MLTPNSPGIVGAQLKLVFKRGHHETLLKIYRVVIRRCVDCFSHGHAKAESLLATNIESRVVLAFKVNDDAVTGMLPSGWKALTLPKGPFAGANVFVLFADGLLGPNAEGKPLSAPNSRYTALVAYGVTARAEASHVCRADV